MIIDFFLSVRGQNIQKTKYENYDSGKIFSRINYIRKVI